MAAADKSLSDFVGRHGACQAVVSALEQHPRDLQLQASGVKAVRALALGGGRNVEILADARGPVAIARAQGLFLRDREVQLACLGAVETLCRGGNQASRKALMDAGGVNLLESALIQFSSDAEVVSQGLRALVEVVLSGAINTAPVAVPPTGANDGGGDSAGKQKQKRRHGNSNVPVAEPSSSLPMPSSSLPELAKPVGDGTTPPPPSSSATATAAARKPPTQKMPGQGATVIIADVSRAVGTVLAILDRDPCRDVCLSAFDALTRLLINLGTADSDPGGDVWSADGSADQRLHRHQGNSNGFSNDSGSTARRVGGLLLLAKVRYAVKRGLKINHRDGALASRGGNILTLIAMARGRALTQQ